MLLTVGLSNSPLVVVSFERNEKQFLLLHNKRTTPFEEKQNQPPNDKSSSTNNQKVNFSDMKGLSPEEQKRVEELKRIDSKVRAHEMAHLSAGGGLVRGGANFVYEIGPDGKAYAVAGEVNIDMSADPNDPEKTIQKMQQVIRAALAPADPSTQDRSVAQKASNIEAQMRAKMFQEKSKSTDIFLVYRKYDLSSTSNKGFDNQENIPPFDNSFVSLKRRVSALI